MMISNVFPPGFIGGYELGAYDFARYLVASGHEVAVLTSDYFQDDEGQISDMLVERTLDCSITHDRERSGKTERESVFINIRNIRKISSFIRRFKPDAVITFNTAGLGPLGAYQFLSAVGVPTLAYFMDTPFAAIDPNGGGWAEYSRIFGDLRQALPNVISMSRGLSVEMEPITGPVSRRAVYVPGWVDLDGAVMAAEGARSKLQSSSGRRFVFCSRVAEHKGLTVMLDAVEILRGSGSGGFTLDVYGAGDVSPFLQQVSRRGLQSLVTYRGILPKSEMVPKFRDYDALLFPTWEREPFGFVVTEAAAFGFIPIMTMGIGASEWFFDGVDCIKIERTGQSLAAAMRSLIELDNASLLEFQLRCQSNSREYFAMDMWMKVIHDEILRITKPPVHVDWNNVAKMEASFMVLNDIWCSI